MQTNAEPGAPRPTGLDPHDPGRAAWDLAMHLGTRMNVPQSGAPGLLMASGNAAQISAAAQVAQALALADIARSLNEISNTLLLKDSDS
ncbi:hypothetical protein [Streptomyces sp. NPDC059278]|uniref:hypothetical protein n=1 Tax=Streptomyces sp. NPDC059278 TaxID=3346801 RepID=UPI0036A08503